MRSVPITAWKTPPRWLYWVAAPFAPVFVALGAVLCVVISVIIGELPARGRNRNRRV
jgi:hypothetical protein